MEVYAQNNNIPGNRDRRISGCEFRVTSKYGMSSSVRAIITLVIVLLLIYYNSYMHLFLVVMVCSM